MAVKPIPDGYHTVTPYLITSNTASALEFYKKALGATELVLMGGPGGKVMHAEMQIGDSRIMLGDECAEGMARSPESYGGTPVGICLYVPNVDALFERAVAAGAKVTRPVQNQFYGDRSGTITDPYGHLWTIGTHVEDVTPEEMRSRMAALMQPA